MKEQPSATVRIPGFELPLLDDRVIGRGGGVAVHVRYGVQSNHINCPSSSEFQCVGVNIYSSRSSITVITAYRPPDSDSKTFADFLDRVLAGLPRVASRNICLVGDFNAKHDSWLSSQTSDIAGHLCVCHQRRLGAGCAEPTFTTNSGKEVQLDFMFVNQPLLVQSGTTLTPLADYRPTLLQLSCGGPQHARSNPYFARDYQHADYEGLRDTLCSLDWSRLHLCTEPSAAVSAWSDILYSP